MKPYYSNQSVEIYHCSLEELLPTLRTDQFDWVVTDPPYGVNKDGAPWDQEFGLGWLKTAHVARVGLAIMPGIINLIDMPKRVEAATTDHLREGLDDHSPFDQVFRWVLSTFVINGRSRSPFGFGNWIPTVIYTRDGQSLHFNVQDSTEIILKEHKGNHPSPKPYSHMSWLMSRLKGKTFLDPYCGSGTTGLAARAHGWTGVMCDKKEKYCELAAKRQSQELLDFQGVDDAESL